MPKALRGSPMRMFALTLLIAALPLGDALAQSSPPVTPEQQKKLKERDPLVVKATELRKAGRFKEAAAIAEQVLKLDRANLGETHGFVLKGMRWLVGIQEQASDF